MKKILIPAVVISMMISCKQPEVEIIDTKAPVDSLIKKWCKNWNLHDSAAVRNMFTSDALLIDDNLIAANAGELSDKWISPNIRVVSDLKASQLQEWSSGERAGYTGKYELSVVIKDSVVARPSGVFSVSWINSGGGEWKITTAVIHSFVEK